VLDKVPLGVCVSESDALTLSEIDGVSDMLLEGVDDPVSEVVQLIVRDTLREFETVPVDEPLEVNETELVDDVDWLLLWEVEMLLLLLAVAVLLMVLVIVLLCDWLLEDDVDAVKEVVLEVVVDEVPDEVPLGVALNDEVRLTEPVTLILGVVEDEKDIVVDEDADGLCEILCESVADWDAERDVVLEPEMDRLSEEVHDTLRLADDDSVNEPETVIDVDVVRLAVPLCVTDSVALAEGDKDTVDDKESEFEIDLLTLAL
jgi:hypothetical protein